MRLLTGPGVFTKRDASFTPGHWLHDWFGRFEANSLALAARRKG